MNKELLNVCYKFFNRFINAEELIEQLNGIEKNEDIENIITEIKRIMDENPNKEDEYSKKRKERLNDLIGKLSLVSNDEEFGSVISKRVENLKKEYEKEIDSNDRWFNIVKYINDNDYFNKCFDSLSKYELLEFIAQYIKAPFPPQLSDEEFQDLVKVGIEKDEREWLWRLAFNYQDSDHKFDSIVNYYIKVKDGYYLVELISAVGDNLNIDYIVRKIKDKELIDYLVDHKDIISRYVSEEQFDKLVNK